MEVELDTHSKGKDNSKSLKVKGKVAVKLAMPAFRPRLRQAEPENSTLVLHGADRDPEAAAAATAERGGGGLVPPGYTFLFQHQHQRYPHPM